MFQWEVDELADNRPNRFHRYRITVDTPLKWNAGTKSNVQIVLFGKEKNTGRRKLKGVNNMVCQK